MQYFEYFSHGLRDILTGIIGKQDVIKINNLDYQC